jgi:hypothetical protein
MKVAVVERLPLGDIYEILCRNVRLVIQTVPRYDIDRRSVQIAFYPLFRAVRTSQVAGVL